jgi:hypothetical protein
MTVYFQVRVLSVDPDYAADVSLMTGGSASMAASMSTAFVIEYSTPFGGQESIAYVKSTNSSCSWSFCAFSEAFLAALDTGQTIYDISPDV